jgi:hypothetical protein
LNIYAKRYLDGDFSINAMSSCLHKVADLNPNGDMIYATTRDSFIFFYSSSSKSFSMESFNEMMKFLYGMSEEETKLLLNKNLKDCRNIIASKVPRENVKLIVADIETYKHYVVKPKFFVMEKQIDEDKQDNKVNEDKKSENGGEKTNNNKRAAFSTTIDGKEVLFGLKTEFKMQYFTIDYISSSKYCFIKALTNKGFSESQVLGYMFRYLDVSVLYECLDKGEIHLTDYINFLKPMLKDCNSNIFIECPHDIEDCRDKSISEKSLEGTTKIHQGQFMLPGPINYVMMIENHKVYIRYAFNIGQNEFIDTYFIDRISRDDKNFILHSYDEAPYQQQN